MLLIVKYTAAA
uniref:Uncharacterized protein n=1 Tax=Anguilla anguilla TaxID=7936 RepID=A0A0E9SDK5_ANGAN